MRRLPAFCDLSARVLHSHPPRLGQKSGEAAVGQPPVCDRPKRFDWRNDRDSWSIQSPLLSRDGARAPDSQGGMRHNGRFLGRALNSPTLAEGSYLPDDTFSQIRLHPLAFGMRSLCVCVFLAGNSACLRRSPAHKSLVSPVPKGIFEQFPTGSNKGRATHSAIHAMLMSQSTPEGSEK
jgi:hypothetical protein